MKWSSWGRALLHIKEYEIASIFSRNCYGKQQRVLFYNILNWILRRNQNVKFCIKWKRVKFFEWALKKYFKKMTKMIFEKSKYYLYPNKYFGPFLYYYTVENVLIWCENVGPVLKWNPTVYCTHKTL